MNIYYNEFDGAKDEKFKEKTNGNLDNDMKTKQMTDLKDDVNKKNDVEAKFENLENHNEKSQEINKEISENMPKPEIVHNVSSDVPVAIVTGDPVNLGKKLDWDQGDNPYHTRGNCGLVSISNLLKMAGIDADENEITKYALDNKLCSDPLYGCAKERGWTDQNQRIEILKAYGVEAENHPQMSINDIATEVEKGKGVIMMVNDGYLWDNPVFVKDSMDSKGNIHTNHIVTVTSTARDPLTGEVSGLYICDSGRGMESDSHRFLSIDELNKCYTNIKTAGVQVTKNPIR